MKYEDSCYIAASAKHINKTHPAVVHFSSKICLTFYNELYFLYNQELFPHSMSFKKEMISSLMSNSDTHNKIYYQATKKYTIKQQKIKSKRWIRISVTFPTLYRPTKLSLKNAANTKATSFNCATHRNKKTQEVEKAYINCKEKFIPVKRIEIKKTTTTVFRLDLQKWYLRKCRNLSSNNFDHITVIESIPSSIQSNCK